MTDMKFKSSDAIAAEQKRPISRCSRDVRIIIDSSVHAEPSLSDAAVHCCSYRQQPIATSLEEAAELHSTTRPNASTYQLNCIWTHHHQNPWPSCQSKGFHEMSHIYPAWASCLQRALTRCHMLSYAAYVSSQRAKQQSKSCCSSPNCLY